MNLLLAMNVHKICFLSSIAVYECHIDFKKHTCSNKRTLRPFWDELCISTHNAVGQMKLCAFLSTYYLCRCNKTSSKLNDLLQNILKKNMNT